MKFKTIISALLVAVLAIATADVTAKVYTEKEMKQFAKLAAKSAKSRAKQLQKEKWVYSGTADLQYKLEMILLKTEEFGGDCVERVAEISDAPTVAIGEKLARSSVEQDISREIRTMIKGIIDTHTKVDSRYHNDVYIDNWTAQVAQELNGNVQKSLVLYKKNKDNTYTVRVVFLTSIDARRIALESLAREITDDNELAAAIRAAALGTDPTAVPVAEE